MQIIVSGIPTSSTGSGLDTAIARSDPDLSVKTALPCYREFWPDKVMTDRNNARCTAISDFDVEPASTSGTILANNQDRKDKPGNADSPSGSASDQSPGCHNEVFVCEFCNKIFLYSYSLKRHLGARHGKDQKQFSCDVCHKQFNRKDVLNTHKKTIHDGNREPRRSFPCQFCKKSFVHEESWRRHHQLHIDKQEYPCEHCGKKFKNKHYLNDHKKSHITGKKRFQCHTCHQKFDHSSHLNNHMKRHAEGCDKPCKKCGEIFICRKLLKRHMFSRHEEGKLYLCPICNADYTTKPAFRKHYRNKHMGTQEPVTVTKTNKHENIGIQENIYSEGKEGNACNEPDQRKTCSGLEARSTHSEPEEEGTGSELEEESIGSESEEERTHSELEKESIGSESEEERTHSELEEEGAGSEHIEKVPEDLNGRRDFPGKLTTMWTNTWTNRSRSTVPAP